MISVAKEDRDVLCFFWDSDLTSVSPQIQVVRFFRVVFGVSFSPFLLNAVVQHHLNLYKTSHCELVGHLLRSMYVTVSSVEHRMNCKPTSCT